MLARIFRVLGDASADSGGQTAPLGRSEVLLQDLVLPAQL